MPRTSRTRATRTTGTWGAAGDASGRSRCTAGAAAGHAPRLPRKRGRRDRRAVDGRTPRSDGTETRLARALRTRHARRMDHRDLATLEAGLAEVRGSPSDCGLVELIVCRP